MKKIVVVAAIALLVLLLLGCTKSYNYPTGYAAYGQQQAQQPNQGYVGGGCAVSAPEQTLTVPQAKTAV